MSRKGLHRQTIALALLFGACGGMKDAGSVADKFVDHYYVEADQDSALPLTTGVASLRLREELKLTQEARRGDPGMQVRPIRVYYRRTSLTGNDREREAEYELDIRPQGGGELQRGARVTLVRQQDGTWRVSRFSESQPR
jgi:hypothetical protein